MSVELVFRDKIADAFCKGEKRKQFSKGKVSFVKKCIEE